MHFNLKYLKIQVEKVKFTLKQKTFCHLSSLTLFLCDFLIEKQQWSFQLPEAFSPSG